MGGLEFGLDLDFFDPELLWNFDNKFQISNDTALIETEICEVNLNTDVQQDLDPHLTGIWGKFDMKNQPPIKPPPKPKPKPKPKVISIPTPKHMEAVSLSIPHQVFKRQRERTRTAPPGYEGTCEFVTNPYYGQPGYKGNHKTVIVCKICLENKLKTKKIDYGKLNLEDLVNLFFFLNAFKAHFNREHAH